MLNVHSFESLAARDGEGLRYALFLSGCPLRCAFCHNPDTWDGAAGTAYTTDELMRKIRRYVPYFRAGGGGVTLSGGEPLCQAEGVLELILALRAEGIHVALDTSGAVPMTDTVCAVIGAVDHVILDLKMPSDELYHRYTGGTLRRTMDFLCACVQQNKRIWVRTVIVPGINDSEGAMDAYLEVLSPYRAQIERYELLPFHTLGFFKYEKLGVENPLKDTAALTRDVLDSLQEYVDKKR